MLLIDHLFSRLPARRSPADGRPSRSDRVKPFQRPSIELAEEYGAPEGSLPAGLIESLRAGTASSKALRTPGR